MIIAIVVIAVLVLGGGGVAVWLLTKSDDKPSNNASDSTSQSSAPSTDESTDESPTDESTDESEPGGGGGGQDEVSSVAQDYADAVNGQDKAGATDLTCDKTGPGVLYEQLAGQVQVETGQVNMTSDEQATVDYTVQGGGDQAVPLFFELKDGAWCVTV
jgi:hypothetical protein